MARPEKPIVGDGPVAELARELRRLRELAGQPAYHVLAAKAHHSRSILAAAAAGHRCPTWNVTRDFVLACGADPEQVRPLWELAHGANARKKRAKGTSREKKMTTASAGHVLPTERQSKRDGGNPAAPPSPPEPPDPWLAQTPRQYRYQLRLLWEWADRPSSKIVWNWRSHSSGGEGRLARSTLYDALNTKLPNLPPLRCIGPIVWACGGDIDQWEGAWRSINIAAFKRANPPPPGLEQALDSLAS